MQLRALTALILAQAALSQDGSVYAKSLDIHGVSILATEEVEDEYLYIAARVYDHMTSKAEPYDMRAAHRASGFRILLIHPDGRFLDLPEYEGEDEELEQAGGLGGCIGEFFISLRVGSPHVLVHELGHGIYHSAIQYLETGGADDEEAWYEERVRAVHDMGIDEAREALGEEEVHEVLLAPEGTFSSDLARAWRNANTKGIWEDEYAGTEPNEYWAEGVALWFRAWHEAGDDPREMLRSRDRGLYDLCARIFPDEDWSPQHACIARQGGVPFEDDDEDHEGEEPLLGGAVQRHPTQAVPDNPFLVGAVVEDGRYEPFPKHLTSCGIVLAATAEVPDGFLELVGQAIGEVFARKEGLDLEAQREVVEALHAYGSLLPVPRTERSLERMMRRSEEAFDRLHEQHSICDIIMAEVPGGQVMEVVEHILHTVTDVGLHYRFPEEWGLSRESLLWEAMQMAIDRGYYEIGSYDDLGDAPQEVIDRILLQEFAYWFITTAWDLQEPYGPGEDEWQLRTPADLKTRMPRFYAVYMRTAARVMSPPSRETLAKIGPTRAEERDR